jgi:2-polyprenyl-6-methoxyphenol hydroxylase-like FAD-dependent oxidoreductase
MTMNSAVMSSETPVLIVGAGPVGLTASILLSRLGVPSLVVERHPSTSIHPKARGINIRTMEIFRQCGVEDAVRAAGLPQDKVRFIIWAESLAGAELERRTPARMRAGIARISPITAALCAQDDLEPVLRRHAESLAPGTLRFGAELTGLEQDDRGITASLAGGERVRARWMIAADGARGRVRELLGIALTGRPFLYRSINVLLHADLTPWTADRPAALYFIEQPDLRATFLTINGVNRWGFLVNNLPASVDVAAYTAARCAALVRQAAGVPDLDIEILGVAPWTAAAQVAERFRGGAVFLAGDAAHHMPPTGGFGLNTGVQDVHNLAWKIAGVVHGWADPALLDSYDAERRPFGEAITAQALANSSAMGRVAAADGALESAPPGGRARPEFLNEIGMIFGAHYASSAVVPDGTVLPEVANPITDHVPVARPGSRAPHVWLERAGTRLSTIDLFGRGFVLLAGPDGKAWRDGGRAAAEMLGVPLEAFAVGSGDGLDDADGSWPAAYGVERDGAVLVRPDAHVGWRRRSSCADPGRDIERALRSMLGRA